ncbi:hypothetical protein [Pseudomonas syringae]|nr:hypothetical protein [Pseudomonas syringae]EPM43181.1 hypothetical protein A246_27994 [Pseudomonas syringae pv. actinidiae ICMP 19098]EPN30238.1 hypothetical protein A243_28202 [Pseudomonas syringae pv. actinidiae ICMP 18883]
MSYDSISLIKQQAKALGKAEGIPLSSAQELFAHREKFSSFHDLTTVASRNPNDPRLMRAAFGVDDLKDAIWEDDLPSELDDLLETHMSEATGGTNATNFQLQDLQITQVEYDENLGLLTLLGSFTYAGDQDPDRMYHGAAFFLQAKFFLIRRFDRWSFDEDHEFEIIAGESDVDRDREDQLDSEYQDYLDSLSSHAKAND